MNKPEETESSQPTPPPLIIPTNTRFDAEPLTGNVNLISILEGVLKSPGRVLYELKSGRAGATAFSLGWLMLFCLAIYGVVVGSLSGGGQLWIAPAKILLGSVLCGLICLPSLYIFVCLGGTDTTLKQVGGELLAGATLTALLLIGFAPVAWVFSQSTDSIALMTGLHLIFWAVALGFGLRLIGRSENASPCPEAKVWMVIYILVCLQMVTAIRPIIGSADTFLPQKKEFFLAHAWRVMFDTPAQK